MSRRRGLPGELWPTPTQQLLLTAALGPDEEARSAWGEARDGLDIDELEPGTFALTPFLYRRLESWGLEDPALAKLKGLYRHSWTRNHILLGELRNLAEAFARDGVELMAAGGSLFVAAVYPETALRPLDRLDLVVHEADAERAAALLQSLEWNAAAGDSGRLGRRSAMWFTNNGRIAVLRSRVLPRAIDVWEDRITFDLEGVECAGLSRERQLLLTCLGEDRHEIWGRVQWLPDLRALVDSGPLDWERVLRDSEALGSNLPLADALTYARGLQIAVPQQVLDELEARRVRKRERIAHRVGRGKREGLVGKVVRRISRQPLRP